MRSRFTAVGGAIERAAPGAEDANARWSGTARAATANHLSSLEAVAPRMSKLRRCGVAVLVATLFATACHEESSRPPTVAPLVDTIFQVNIEGTLRVAALDPEGEALRFDFRFDPDPPSLAQERAGQPRIEAVVGGAVFSWTPAEADVRDAEQVVYGLTIMAADPQGLRAERSLQVTVQRGAVGRRTLRFVAPVGEGLVVAEPCAEVPIEVDSALPDDGVAIEVTAPPAAQCDVPDALCAPLMVAPDGPGKVKAISWCPTDAQLDRSVHHQLRIGARPIGADEPISRRYFLRFVRPDAAGCPGAPPRIEHAPPASLEGPLDLTLHARFSDDLGLKVPPVVVYAFEPETVPETAADLFGGAAAAFAIGEGDWSAVVPNPGLAEGEAGTLYYALLATDDDDAERTRCDHTAVSEIYAIDVRGGAAGQMGNAPCTPCRADAQCGGADDLCVPLLEGDALCTRACDPGAADSCGRDEVCVRVESVEGRAASQCAPADLDCGRACMPDALE
ncbi:MAG: hypothetical protein KC620_19485, partial [Myxococcales bacterium]|nr:hypothetical protein [Myxococcales bacterium]